MVERRSPKPLAGVRFPQPVPEEKYPSPDGYFSSALVEEGIERARAHASVRSMCRASPGLCGRDASATKRFPQLSRNHLRFQIIFDTNKAAYYYANSNESH